MKTNNPVLSVLGSDIGIKTIDSQDFLSLTDIARYKDPKRAEFIIQNWMRNKNTIEYLGLREIIHNPDFKPLEFEGFKGQAGLNSFVMTPKRWIEGTNCIGITSRSGRYGGGTYAHKDIAIKFASWISVEFELYLVKDYQRLKEEEMKMFDRSIKRLISKTNYKIHTDAIKDILIPSTLTASQKSLIYSNEADMLNVVLFGQTAKERREKNTHVDGNMRDYATIQQLIVLSNMESFNAELMRQNIPQSQRINFLHILATQQMKSLINVIPSSLQTTTKNE
ncbi:MAG TPA: KilA-N domain-containing protein [Candidatus Absconditabacterales bacterium]|nr:KilA-N domain-containing protein [Candidatus Absconditabacterales bacterium]HNG96722.1 KilA-N domain-containing protein [Candidatus Absconditabacterales bacterium]